MSRFSGPKGKIVRRFGINLYGNPKLDRLLAKRPNAPGVHGMKHGRRKISDYGQQLTEKQKIKYTYGLKEKQFRVVFNRAVKKTGITADNLLILLESRFDNVVYRIGMAPTRDAARQLIVHGHLRINDRRVNIPSYTLSSDENITIKDSVKSKALVERYIEESKDRETLEWASLDKEQLKGQFIRAPMRSELQSIANEQLVVELYSK